MTFRIWGAILKEEGVSEMAFTDEFFIDIKNIHIAHEYTLDRVQKCEYPRGRGSYGMIYALGGRAEYRFLSGDSFTVSEGDVLFLSPNCAYSITTEKEFKHFTVNFSVHEESSNFELITQPYCLVKEKNTEHLERGFKALVDTWQSKRQGYEMRTVGHLSLLIADFYCEYTSRQNSTSYQRLLPTKEYIDRHFNSHIRLEKLANLSNMSVTNFRREWAKHFSETPIQYRDTVRLYYAKEHLASGYYTVSEIAERCGFRDESYFVRFFKKKTGVTPGEFKKNSI